VTGVFIVARSPASRANLRAMVAEAGFAIVGASADLTELDNIPPDSEPDLLLVDATRDVLETERAAWSELAERTRVVLLADRVDLPYFAQAFREGAVAVLPRELSSPQLQAALQAVFAGFVVAHPSGLGFLAPARAFPAAAATPLTEPLTPREREVLQMLSAGLGNKEIAARLSISDHTAKFHVASILGKLGASTRTEAVAVGLRHGLILL
jgi:DNA-binding NarL/FixJ family response regulator